MLGGAAGLAEVADHAADVVVAAEKAAAVVDTAVGVVAVVFVEYAAAVVVRVHYERPAALTWKIPAPVASVAVVVPFAAAFVIFDALKSLYC